MKNQFDIIVAGGGISGIFAELNDRMVQAGGMVDNGFSPTVFRRAAAELLAEAGVKVSKAVRTSGNI